MPHMSNLPWLNMYFLIFVIIMMMLSSSSSPLQINNPNWINSKTHPKQTKNKNKWMW